MGKEFEVLKVLSQYAKGVEGNAKGFPLPNQLLGLKERERGELSSRGWVEPPTITNFSAFQVSQNVSQNASHKIIVAYVQNRVPNSTRLFSRITDCRCYSEYVPYLFSNPYTP